MNILILTAYPPVLEMHGGGVRMYHNIRILAEEHSVHLISFVENDEERDLLRPLNEICDSVRSIDRIPDLRPRPWSLDPVILRYFDVLEMHRALDESLAKYSIDVLQCEYLQMAQFRRPGIFNLWTAHEIMSVNAYEEFLAERNPFEKIRAYYRWMAMLRYETQAAKKFDRVVTMTESDALYLRSYVPSADVRAIPIGVDSSWYYPSKEQPDADLEAVFLGNFRHTPNVEAVQFLMEHVVPHFPEFRFRVAGSNLPKGLVDGARVETMGYQTDTRMLYKRPNTIVLAPLFSGTGQRVKLLEAFSMAMPVVTTSKGAAGFPISDSREAFIADSPDDYRSALKMLGRSTELRRQVGKQARQMIVDGFDWEGLGERFLGAVNPISRDDDS